MSYRDKALMIDSLGNNFVATGNSSGTLNATANATVSPAAKARVSLTQLGWAVNNGKGAAAVTVTISVRHASLNGTVVGSWDAIAAAGGSLQDSWAVNIKGKKGVPLSADVSPINASAAAKVSIGGWIDSLSDG